LITHTRIKSVFSNIFTGLVSILGRSSRKILANRNELLLASPQAKPINKTKRLRHSTSESLYQFSNKVFRINTHDGKYLCRADILNSGIGQLLAMLSFHSRVLTIRVDLHMREYEASNLRISKFIRKLRKWLKSNYKMQRLGYLWVREQERAKSQHYHLILYMDGNKIRYPAKVNKWIREYWTWQDQPKPPTIAKCYTMVHRDDKQALDESVYRMSYLAKSRGKGYGGHNSKDYSSSKIVQQIR
jgi:hypothetical protein